MTPDVDNGAESAAGDRLPPARVQRATGVQVVAIVAGLLAMACALLMWRDTGFIVANLSTGVSFMPSSTTSWGAWLSVVPAGAAALVAFVALVRREHARWLRYLQIGLWLLALAGFAYIAAGCARLVGLRPVWGALVIGDVSGFVTIVLLTVSLRRPVGGQPRWHLAFVLLAAAVPFLAIAAGGPTGSGILTGIVAACSPAEQKAAGGLDPSQVVSVSVQNQAGQTVASQRLPFRTSGARYRMRLPTGTYSINAATAEASAGDTVYVPQDKTNEEDFNDPAGGCVW